ncbi:hypothetical protein D9M70_652800 [compost metagenome]
MLLGRFRGDVEQDQAAAIDVLQLQPYRFEWFARQQVHRARCALYPQAGADRRRYADADIALHEDHALLADHQRHRQR